MFYRGAAARAGRAPHPGALVRRGPASAMRAAAGTMPRAAFGAVQPLAATANVTANR
ncbi:hypothetical protein BURPS406E_H0187 [Burkholderia pseudomallei 406e]|uniref:Uncharacterized protein n=6 Tax=Burkholderia pseudomallei TaxID=28450 RepID=Q3JQD1_BURP1|nr:hypothetical protein BURPS1710b_2838 [Burkholderia pseudomallei 1710b]ACQ98225.1 conserved hypothetical protein [Burkholderia pseudomallei MSHR346]EDO84749.1 hypothetical protein BURPS406E_H0187 [Burkholderia pseudomallei 406e]EDO94640.1 hypothetical protein BURPSPAST_R0095 [Burkholderia pseudomallei Pasteur 52237]EDS85291.1 hypothetical protein BURPSS13_V0100 [Burkholderia pseudomallei S13]EEC36138.1 hypothetical protein BUC_3038 [Burkholderia pseudomallei 576]EEH23986.1 hypothetical prot